MSTEGHPYDRADDSVLSYEDMQNIRRSNDRAANLVAAGMIGVFVAIGAGIYGAVAYEKHKDNEQLGTVSHLMRNDGFTVSHVAIDTLNPDKFDYQAIAAIDHCQVPFTAIESPRYANTPTDVRDYTFKKGNTTIVVQSEQQLIQDLGENPCQALA